MRWNANDSFSFFEEKDYIDTALVPMVPMAFDGKGKDTANTAEFIQLLVNELERQFKGRVLLFPSFTYFLSNEKKSQQSLLRIWLEAFNTASFSHIFFIGSDSAWHKELEDVGVHYIWLPSVPLANLDNSYKRTIIENQVKQIMNIFVEQWQQSQKAKSTKLIGEF